MEEVKYCSKCLQTKSVLLFNKEKKKADGLSVWCQKCKREYYSTNRESHISNGKKWREANKDLVKSNISKYYENNKDKKLSYGKEWRSDNKVKMANYLKAWKIKNKDTNFSWDKRIKKARVEWGDKWKIKQFYLMARKASKMYGIEFQVDHIIPLKGVNVSGLHVESNLQIITKEENLKKGNRVSQA